MLNKLEAYLLENYCGVDIATAKKQLVDDILKLDITEQLPHLPQRKDGENRIKLEIDDSRW